MAAKTFRAINHGLGGASAFAAVLATQTRKSEASTPPQGHLISGDALPKQLDVLGLAQTMVDITSTVDEALLSRFGVEKGGRRVLSSIDERSDVLTTLAEEDCETQVTPGGSLANTLVAIARLSKAATRQEGSTPLSVCLAGSCGSDALGQFFTSQLGHAGVSVMPVSETEGNGGHTGTVMVLSTADAQRSFLSFFTSERMAVPPALKSAISNSRLVVIEGYLWEMPNAFHAIQEVVALARASGAQVALTAGDPGVVARHREEMLQVLQEGGKHIILFANCEEACELLGRSRTCSGRDAAAALGSLCSVAVVTDGGKGSHVSALGEVHSLAAAMVPQGSALDTCGAGDAYAAGMCYAMMKGYGFQTAGRFASEVAAVVVGRYGAQLQEPDAIGLVRMLPPLSHPLSAKPSSTLAEWHSMIL